MPFLKKLFSNTSKFHLVCLGPNEELKENTNLFTDNMDEILIPVDCVKDLGLMIDKNTDFNNQRENAINKTKMKAGWVLRTFINRSPFFMKTLWKTLIQPHLDYCSQVWAPLDLSDDLKALKEPLRSFTRKITCCRELDYWQRLKKLKMFSTQRRNEIYRII